MRLQQAALIAAVALSTDLAPALAQSPDARAAFARNAVNCQAWFTAHRYAASLPACIAAVQGFNRAITVESNNPWFAYYQKATMLRYVAGDNAALGHHREALRTAIESHRLAVYVYKAYRMDPDDYQAITALVNELQPLEAQERLAIQRGQGD